MEFPEKYQEYRKLLFVRVMLHDHFEKQQSNYRSFSSSFTRKKLAICSIKTKIYAKHAKTGSTPILTPCLMSEVSMTYCTELDKKD